jgi:hypothetical protein
VLQLLLVQHVQLLQHQHQHIQLRLIRDWAVEHAKHRSTAYAGTAYDGR